MDDSPWGCKESDMTEQLTLSHTVCQALSWMLGYRAKPYGTGEGQSFESMALAHGHGDLDHPENPSLVPQHTVSTPTHLPIVRTSMGWEGFSTGSSTSGFLG